jgi:glycosyltransferase involved in cell wall biosynthesis
MKGLPDHITMVSKYFHPEFCSTGQLLMELAVELRRRGCKVSVLTGQARLVGGGKLPPRGSYDGIPVERVWCTRLDNRSVLGKAINRATFTASVLLNLLLKKRPLLLVTSDPPFLCWVGMVMKKLRGGRFVYLLQDIHPDVSVKLGYLKDDALLRKCWDWLNQRAYEEADSIVVLGDDMKHTLDGRYNGNGSFRVRVIRNWADGDFIRPLRGSDNWFRKRLGLEDKFVVQYSGSIGGYHDFETAMAAAHRLRHLPDLKFVFIGEGDKKEDIQRMASDLKLENVSFFPFQPRNYLPYSLTCGDVSLVTLESGLEGLSVPCKFYTSLAAGQAIWGLVGNNSEIARLITKERCGFRTDQGDVDASVEMLTRLYHDRELLAGFKRNARRCFETHFDKHGAVEKYVELLKDINGGGK